MYNLGLPVPPGFVITAYAFKHYIQISGLDKKIFGKLKKLNVEDNDQLQETAKWIQDQIVSTPMPEAIKEIVIESYDEMDVNGSKVEDLMKSGNGALVAVRSSATAEDLPSISENEFVFVKVNEKPFFGKMKELIENVDLNNDEIFVPAMDNYKVEWEKVSEIYKHKANSDKLYKVTTSTGRQITVSPNHSLIVLDEETLKPKVAQMKDLGIGKKLPVVKIMPSLKCINKIDVLDYVKGDDVVNVDDKIYIKSSNNWKIQQELKRWIYLDKNFAYFLGIFVAEGCTYENNCVIVTNMDSFVLERVKACFKNLGINAEVKINKYSLRIYCKTLVRLLWEACGYPEKTKGKGKGCRTKQIPSFIYSAEPEIIGEFLKGCFDGDGTISKTVSYSSVSEKLVSGMSVLLGLLGINYYLKKISNKFLLDLPLSDLEKYREMIGFGIEGKSLKLEKEILNYKNKLIHFSSKNSLRFSKTISKEFRKSIEINLPKLSIIEYYCPLCLDVLDKTSYYKHKLRYRCVECKKTFYQSQLIGKEIEKYVNYDSFGRFVSGSIPWNKSVNTYPNYSQEHFIEKLKSLEEIQLMNVFDESLLWDEIVKIEEVNYDSWVYDFCVPNVENFAAGFGSVITHNTASFAGQQASFMNVKGHKELIAHVLACWASLYTARAIYYRVKNNYPHEKVYIAVVIQKMINSDAAGVMFSVNVVTNNTSEILIEGAYGLGEAVVSGSITPDEFVLDKKTLDVKSKKIAKKTWMYVRDPKTFENIKKVDVPKDLQEESCLKSSEIQKLAELAIKIEKHYGKPQDIEFAIEKGKLYIVQSRPVTTMEKTGMKETSVVNVKMAKGDIDVNDATLLVSGLPASPGVAKGKVVMVRDLADLKKVLKGDILVARMTTPDMVPAMQRASGIVTDEGGSTCFAGKTKVLTDNGFKTMEELYETDERLFVSSLNRDSLKIEWKPILACMKRKSNAIEIGCSQTGNMRGNNLILTPDHKMLTYSNCELVDRKISDVLKNNEMLLVANSIPAFRYCRDMNHDKAYLLGALVTDGHIRHNNRRGSVTFCQKDTIEKKYFINSIKTILAEFSGKDVYSYRKKSAGGLIRGRMVVGSNDNYNHTVCSKSFAEELLVIKENLVEIFLKCHEDVIYNFLAGVIDGDGTYNNSRINIYCGKKGLTDVIVVGCLRLGIVPQVTKNRNIDNIQIVENVGKLLSYTKRVKGDYHRVNGVRLFSAKQLLGGFVNDVNVGGRIKPYVERNLLLDFRKIKDKVLPVCSSINKSKLNLIMKSDTRMIRTNFVRDVGEIDVYNITVLDNHNYIVFTDKLTPLLVNNCHAAIVSREMGIPCVVGTEIATKKLKEGMFVTIDATKGKIYSGNVSIALKDQEKPFLMKTKVKVKVIMDLPELAEHAAASGADGVGLLRSEFINMENRVHPVYMIEHGRREEFISHLVESLKKILKAFKGKPVWYRTLDARTDEFRNLKGGEEEPKEDNPMMGWRSIRRSLDQPELLTAEYEAIARVHKAGYKNIGIMIPLVTDNLQVREAKKIFYEHTGIKPVKDIQFGVMIETPAAVQMIDEICKEGISFVSLGTNDLTQFTLAADRNSARIAKLYDEMHPAILRQIHKVITICKKYNIETSICGQAGSKEEMAKFLHKEGIDSVSANVDAVNSIRRTFAKIEGLIK